MVGSLPPSFFTPSDRIDALGQLESFAGSADAVLGLLLVGSGSRGFADRFSDVDVVLVVEPAGFGRALEATRSFVEAAFRPLFVTAYEHRFDVHVLCLLLRNYLVVDVGVWSGDALFASSPEWRTVRARDTRAATAIADAMAHNPRLPRTRAPVVTGDDPTWQSVYGRFVARKRSDADHDDGVPDEPAPAAERSDGRDPYPERGYSEAQARFLRILDAVP